MVSRSGQMGVPVITVDNSVIVGFDEPRLAQLLAGAGTGTPRLGATVAPVSGGGLRVGQVHPGSLASRAGLQPGDVILHLNEQAVDSPEQLRDQLSTSLQRHLPVRMVVQRDGMRRELSLPRL